MVFYLCMVVIYDNVFLVFYLCMVVIYDNVFLVFYLCMVVIYDNVLWYFISVWLLSMIMCFGILSLYGCYL